MADQKEVVVYVRRPSWRWWLTKRLLRRSGYYFKVIDATNNSRLCSSPVHYMGRETMPYVSIDHRPVGGLSELKTLERSVALENLVRGGVWDATEAVKMAHEVIRNGAATLRLDEPVE
jgi:glutaredoxin